MAQFELRSFIDVGTQSYHTYTSWRVTRDVAGLDIIDESIKDASNLYTWNTPLPDGLGGFHADLNEIHLWIRVHTLETDQPWQYIGVANQNDQQFIITENGNIIDQLNSISAGIQ